MWYNLGKFYIGRTRTMYIKARTLILTSITCFIFTGCASYFYSQVPEPFTTNAETLAMDNQSYQKKLQKMVDKNFSKADIKITTDHFNVLIAGQVESKKTKDALTMFIKKQQFVRDVYNYTTIAAKPSYSSSSSIVSDVEDRLAQEPDIDSNKITVTFVDGVIYLMGTNIGDLTHLNRAIKGVYAINGVNKVVDLVRPGVADYYSGR